MKKTVLVVAIVIVAMIVVGYRFKGENISQLFAKNTDIGAEAAKAKAVDFVKNNLVQPGTDVSAKSVSAENGLYKIVLNIKGQEYPSYITKDGTKFIKDAFDIADIEKQTASSNTAAKSAPKDIPKTDKPVVDLYVMAFCPYGNKAEDTLKPVYALLKDKVDFNFHYIVSTNGNDIQSLHGPKEVTEDQREVCVLKNYGKDKWMDIVTYVNDKCGSDGSCWEGAVKNSGIDAAKIESCVSSDGLNLLKADEKASNDAGANGSPTMIINGVETQAVYQYGNSESYKQAICAAFNETPSECSQQLSSQSSASAAQGGSCGN